MHTLEYLTDPALAWIFWPKVLTALVIGVIGAVLSVFVVLKRLAFIGQGVSHAAFGGVGLAYMLGLAGTGGMTRGADLSVLGVVLLFSVGAALGIAWLSDRARTQADTAIGIVLATSMAVGFILYRRAASSAPVPPLESVLFGDVLSVGWLDAWLAIGATVLSLGVLWVVRRPLLFWAFDEQASLAFGVSGARMKVVLLVLLALAVVVTMKLAGIVLATALLVMPGAISLQISERFGSALMVSVASALAGVIAGVVLSFELDLQTGPSIVLVLTLLFALARGARAFQGARARRRPTMGEPGASSHVPVATGD